MEGFKEIDIWDREDIINSLPSRLIYTSSAVLIAESSSGARVILKNRWLGKNIDLSEGVLVLEGVTSLCQLPSIVRQCEETKVVLIKPSFLRQEHGINALNKY